MVMKTGICIERHHVHQRLHSAQRHAALRHRRAAVLATATAGARDAWQASLQASKRTGRPQIAAHLGQVVPLATGKTASTNAYAVVLGPISEERKYSKWVYPILALKAALHQTRSASTPRGVGSRRRQGKT